MKTAKDLELSLLLKESHIQQLKLKVNELEQNLKNCHEFYLGQLKEKQEKINKAIEYIDTWGYDEYELFRIDENNPNITTDEDVITIVKTLENILKGDDKE